MSEPIRIRARLKDGLAEVHVLMPHPMETGFRKDTDGQTVAAHYITDVRISVEGRPVLTAQMGLAVSQDPLLSFRFKGARAGDRITVAWIDNLGGERSDEARVA
jgi:sulfur-oxidizing protein SoxZ